MSLKEHRRVAADGSVVVYAYHRMTDYERARRWLDRFPLVAEPTGKAHAVRWRGKTARYTVTFHDQVIRRLIADGYAVCLGQSFVEKKGVVR